MPHIYVIGMYKKLDVSRTLCCNQNVDTWSVSGATIKRKTDPAVLLNHDAFAIASLLRERLSSAERLLTVDVSQTRVNGPSP